VVRVFSDNDLSAFTRRKPRPGYIAMLADINAGTIDTIVAWHPDRLHRHNAELEPFIAVVERAGTAIATVQAGVLDLATPTGRMHARIVGAVAQYESEHKRERLRAKHRELAQNGQMSGGGRRAFGYETDGVTIREDEAAEIRDGVRRIIAGESLRSITADWRDRVPSVTGAPWSPTTVKRLLTSGRISGQREHKGVYIGPAKWAAIVDPDETLRVRAVLSARAKATDSPTPRTYLLSGLVRCGRCGKPMVAAPVMRKGIRYPRYGCQVDRGGCGRCGIGAAGVDELITDAVLKRLDSKMLARRATQHRLTDAPFVVRLQGLEARQIETAEAFAAGEMPRAAHAAAQAKLQEGVDFVRSRIAQGSKRDLKPYIGQGGELRKRWPEMSVSQRRAVIETVINSITIAPTTRANNKFDPGRITDIDWSA
jgi:site-specific DNA recombinase